MVTTTSSTTSFSMDVDDIIEAALEPLGGEHTSGIEASKARRTLNLILIELQNKNIPLHKISAIDQVLTNTVASYTLSASVIDVLDCAINNSVDGAIELPVERWSLKDYDAIPDKTTSNRPTLYVVERLRDAIKVKFWPVPNLTTFTAKLLVTTKIEDVTASYQRIDVPSRYLPLIIKWLSYELSLTRPGLPAELVAELKARYRETMPDTFEEDRERVDLTITIGGVSGW